MASKEIEDASRELVRSFGGQLPGLQLREIDALVNAGEPGIAVENLCTQLYEYDVPIGAEVCRSLQTICVAMGVDARYWERLRA